MFNDPKSAKAQAKAQKAYHKATRPWFKKKRFILLLLILVIVVIAVISSRGDSSSDSSSSSISSSSSEGAAAPDSSDAAAAGLNQAVRDGKFEFTVTGQDCSKSTIGTSQYAQSEAQGVYCIVSMHVSNIGDEAQYFDASSQKAFDAQGREYSADSGAAIYLDEANSFLEQLNPGSAVDGQLVYDVPVGTQLIKMELHDSPFSGGAAVNLG
jgi:septal ring-binding cell division protein DamX